MRSLTVTNVTCQACGASVELFSDEQRRKCPQCGRVVARESAPTCASWCPSAESCVGSKRYGELVESGQLEPSTKKPAED